MSRLKAKLATSAAGIALVSAALGANAQNLVANAQFNTDKNGWANLGIGTSIWTNVQDAGSAPSAGSVKVTTTDTNAGNWFGITSCVAVSAASTYDVGAYFYLPSGQTAGISGYGRIEVLWYMDAPCTVSVGSHPNDFGGIVVSQNQWLSAQMFGPLAPPAAALGMKVFPQIVKSTGGSAGYFGYVDNVYVAVSGTFPAAPTMSLSSSLNPSCPAVPVTFTFSISQTTPPPIGTATFKDNGVAISPPIPLALGQAMFTTSSLTNATHSITVSYSGDFNYALANTSPLMQVVGNDTASPTVTPPATLTTTQTLCM